MVSIKHYLDHRRAEAAPHTSAALLNILASAAVVADESNCAAFQADIERFAGIFSECPTLDEQLRIVGVIGQVVENYNGDITALLRRHRHELKDIVTMTAETVATVSGANKRSAERLRSIANQFELASEIKELDALKANINDCLKTLRDEILHQRHEMEDLVVCLRRDIERGSHAVSLAEGSDLDAATGLPQKRSWRAVMHTSIPAGQRRFVVTFVVNRVDAINLRFGGEVGDRVLCRFSELSRSRLHPSIGCFAGTGQPSLL